MRATRTSGFTLVELLVVIAIIGMLVALLLPAVQAARESGRRTTCYNNQHELGLGIYLYEQTKKELPHNDNQHSWVAYILPYIEQDVLYKKYDYSVNWSNAKNQQVVNTALASMVCPSAPPAYARIDKIGGGKTASPGDYAPLGNVANGLVRSGLIKKPFDQTGVMKKNTYSAWALVLDGTANTLLLAEDAGRPEYWIAGPIRGPNSSPKMIGNNGVSGGRVLGAGWADNRTTIPLHGFTWDGRRAPGPCAINCTNNNETFAFHPTGACVTFADRHVRFLNRKIDIAVYAAMITQNGKDPYNMP